MTRQQRIIMENMALFDGENDTLLQGYTVIVSGQEIAAVERGPVEKQDGDMRLDLSGLTLMPGLIDAHFHCYSPDLNIVAMDSMYPSRLALHASKYLEDTLAQGFTTVRDAGGADTGMVQASDEGLIKGPRLFISGKAISQTGGHGDLRPAGGVSLCGCNYEGRLARLSDGADSMRRIVREQLREGAHQIKLFISGGVLSPTDPIWMDQFTDEEISVAVEEAARRRTYVMAHAHTASAAKRCAQLGVRSIEHGTMIDRETADVIVEKGSFVVPTLTVMEAFLEGVVPIPDIYKDKLKAVAEVAYSALEYCQNAGVSLGFGTDLFGQMHGMELKELVSRARLGGALAALRSATSVNAKLMKQEGRLGIVRAGALADLIAVKGDPISDISVMIKPEENLHLIMKGGEIIKHKQLVGLEK